MFKILRLEKLVCNDKIVKKTNKYTVLVNKINKYHFL